MGTADEAIRTIVGDADQNYITMLEPIPKIHFTIFLAYCIVPDKEEEYGRHI